ncbi:CBS domain protein [Paecilomyces variotii No. 5]|uniref:Protein SDS23 n=1 Tax=Byssochlamys spectabilis (strain No. 5 / NBRC 109023) TaxID=1356009 RepID=V5HUL3_BYSSN|nr:CBS domain protein [Paecilomyces variotii No. 5]
MADRRPEGGRESSTEPPIVSPRSSMDLNPAAAARSPPLRSTDLSISSSNRRSFHEALRSMPQSPRARRQPSLTQAAIQSLIDNPPVPNPSDPAFAGRDWRQITIGELVRPDDLKYVQVDTDIEEATNLLIDSGAPVLLIRETAQDTSAVSTFDYTDLNTYLLLVVGLAQPDPEDVEYFQQLATRAREGHKIPLKDVKAIGRRIPLVTLPASASLVTTVETFGGGVHWVVVVKDNSSEVVGIFSQFRLVKFLWENGRSFPVIDELYPQYLKDLRIGSQNVISINGDRPLYEALRLMDQEGINSLAVVDSHFNVVGNISAADVKLLTKSSSLPLLHNTCIHFISVILSTRGLDEGKDSFPVFHVNPISTLAHTVAKMVATRSHRLWVTDPQSPSSSGPPTPSHSSVHIPLYTQGNQTSHTPPLPSPGSPPPINSQPGAPPNYSNPHLPTPPQPYQAAAILSGTPPSLPQVMAPSIPASALPGARLSGRLVGVVSLTDVLNLYARASGLRPADPAETRSNRRRRSSSASVNVRKSGDIGREFLGRGGP